MDRSYHIGWKKSVSNCPEAENRIKSINQYRFLNFVRLAICCPPFLATSWNQKTLCSTTDRNVSRVTFSMVCAMRAFNSTEFGIKALSRTSFRHIRARSHTDEDQMIGGLPPPQPSVLSTYMSKIFKIAIQFKKIDENIQRN